MVQGATVEDVNFVLPFQSRANFPEDFVSLANCTDISNRKALMLHVASREGIETVLGWTGELSFSTSFTGLASAPDPFTNALVWQRTS